MNPLFEILISCITFSGIIFGIFALFKIRKIAIHKKKEAISLTNLEKRKKNHHSYHIMTTSALPFVAEPPMHFGKPAEKKTISKEKNKHIYSELYSFE